MYISVDLGGTKTRIAFSKDLQSLDSVEKFQTLQNWNDELNKISEVITPIVRDSNIDAVSFGIPGTLDLKERIFLKVPNYKDLEGKSFDVFSKLFEDSTQVYFNNDASLSCLGEAVHGAGKQYKNVAYITLSTGVGGALVVNKKLWDIYRAYEPGHHIMNLSENNTDSAGINGSMEYYLSGTGFKQRYKILPEDCTDSAIWDEYGRLLAMGLVNVTAFWNPEVIVLGGSLRNKYDLFISSAENKLSSYTGIHIPVIKKSLLEDDSGLVGGFEFINQKSA